MKLSDHPRAEDLVLRNLLPSHNHIPNESDPILEFHCYRHGKQHSYDAIRSNHFGIALTLECGCQWVMRGDSTWRFNGNVLRNEDATL